MSKDNFEVFTTIDKAKRDELFNELCRIGTPNEQQAVKFSGCQPVLNEFGEQAVSYVHYRALGKGGKVHIGKAQARPVWQTNYSVAYPRD